MNDEPSGEYYDYTITMKPERPWLLPYHQTLIYRTFNCSRDGEGNMKEVFLTFEQSLEVIRRLYHLTCGMPQVVYLTGWQFEGHDSKYPSWAEVNRHLKRPQDETAVESLRWLMREAPKYNCKVSLHLNMFDAYMDSPLWDLYVEKDIIAKDKDGYESRTWELPPDWKETGKVSLSRITLEGSEPLGEVPVADGKVTLGVGAGEALKICASDRGHTHGRQGAGSRPGSGEGKLPTCG